MTTPDYHLARLDHFEIVRLYVVSTHGRPDLHVKVWDDSEGTNVVTITIGHRRLTSGRFRSDDDAILAHLRGSEDD